MKKLLVWIVILGALVGLVVLVEKGVIRWQPLTMLAAVLAAPFRLLLGYFNDREQDISESHRLLRAEEAGIQRQMESEVTQRNENIAGLRSEIETLDTRLEELRRQRAAVSGEIEKMSAEMAS